LKHFGLIIIIIKSSFNMTPLTQTQRSLQMSIIENRAKVIKKRKKKFCEILSAPKLGAKSPPMDSMEY